MLHMEKVRFVNKLLRIMTIKRILARSTFDHLYWVLMWFFASKLFSIFMVGQLWRPAVHIVKGLFRDWCNFSPFILIQQSQFCLSLSVSCCEGVLVLNVLVHFVILFNYRLYVLVNKLLVGGRLANVAHLQQLISLFLLSFMHEALLIDTGWSSLRRLSLGLKRLFALGGQLWRKVFLLYRSTLNIILVHILQALRKYRSVFFSDVLSVTWETLRVSFIPYVDRCEWVKWVVEQLASVINRPNEPRLSDADKPSSDLINLLWGLQLLEVGMVHRWRLETVDDDLHFFDSPAVLKQSDWLI